MAVVTLDGLLMSGSSLGVRWSKQRLIGWADGVATTLKRTQKPRAHGSWRSEAFYTDRTIIASGRISAADAGVVRDAVDAIKAACALSEVLLSVDEHGLTRTAMVSEADAPQITDYPTALVKDYSLQLVAADPRKYGAQFGGPGGISTLLPMSSGGLTFPITFPITFPATVVTGQIGISNPGDVESPIRMRVDGPCTGPIISHIAAGKQLVFASSYVLAAGNWLDIVMGAGRELSVLENGQASRNGSIISRASFGLDPGDNTIGFNAAVYNAASLLTVYASPAWI